MMIQRSREYQWAVKKIMKKRKHYMQFKTRGSNKSPVTIVGMKFENHTEFWNHMKHYKYVIELLSVS